MVVAAAPEQLHDDGTRLTETWEFTPDGLAMFADEYSDRAGAEIDSASGRRTGHPSRAGGDQADRGGAVGGSG